MTTPIDEAQVEFAAGDQVEKFGGAYGGPGIVKGTFPVADGSKRYNVAHRIEGGYGELIHIYSLTQIRSLGAVLTAAAAVPSSPSHKEHDVSHIQGQPAAQAVPPTEADMHAFSASDAACTTWPDDTAEHRTARAAYCQGAADYGGAAQAGKEVMPSGRDGPNSIASKDSVTPPGSAPTPLGRADDGWRTSLEEARECVRNLWRSNTIRQQECYYLIAILDKVERRKAFSAPVDSQRDLISGKK